MALGLVGKCGSGCRLGGPLAPSCSRARPPPPPPPPAASPLSPLALSLALIFSLLAAAAATAPPGARISPGCASCSSPPASLTCQPGTLGRTPETPRSPSAHSPPARTPGRLHLPRALHPFGEVPKGARALRGGSGRVSTPGLRDTEAPSAPRPAGSVRSGQRFPGARVRYPAGIP